MIRFACKAVRIEDIVRCSFGLGRTEYLVLSTLAKSKGMLQVSEIAKRLSLDRTGVQKAATSLVAKGLAGRRKCDLPGGGYAFCYSARGREELKRKMRAAVRSWSAGVLSGIDSW